MIHITRDTREKIEGKFERHVKSLLSSVFHNSHFFTLSERAKYRPMEDEYIFKMNRDEIPEIVEVYYMGDWICDVSSTMRENEIVNKVWHILQLKVEAKKKKEREADASSNNSTAK